MNSHMAKKFQHNPGNDRVPDLAEDRYKVAGQIIDPTYVDPEKRDELQKEGSELVQRVRDVVGENIRVPFTRPDDPVMKVSMKVENFYKFVHIGGRAIVINGEFVEFLAGGIQGRVGRIETNNMEFLVESYKALHKFLGAMGKLPDVDMPDSKEQGGA